MSRLATLQQLEKEKPNDSFVKFAIGLEYISTGDLEQAKSYLEQLRQTAPEYTATYLHLGKLYEQLEEPDKAGKCYEQGIAITKAKNEQKNWRELNEALTNLRYD